MMQVSFLPDRSFSPGDNILELNFSELSMDPALSRSSSSSFTFSSANKKRKRSLESSDEEFLPPNKKLRASPTNSANIPLINSEPKKVLRRSARLRNKQMKAIKVVPIIPALKVSSLPSSPISPVRPKRPRRKAQSENLISKCLNIKWNASATPLRSSLKKKCKTKKIKHKSEDKRVNWGNIKCRKYEQRCGILSSAVPSASGPSLHLGRLLSETTTKIDEYESVKKENDSWGQLPKKERIQRVKQFSLEDVKRKHLKRDMDEIRLLNKSRNEIGCKCVSIYKMKKDQLISRILYLNVELEKKELKKEKKGDLFNMLRKIQFEKYGRYDVCCVDDSCICFVEGIECQIDDDCCSCGGDVVYNNYINGIEINANKKKKSKKDSLCCANPNGNTLNVSVLDYVDKNKKNHVYQHDIAKNVESSFLSFESPLVQRRIKEWNEHYNINDHKLNNNHNINDHISCVLDFKESV